MEDLWRTRLTWAAMGSAATVAVIRLSTPTPVVQAPARAPAAQAPWVQPPPVISPPAMQTPVVTPAVATSALVAEAPAHAPPAVAPAEPAAVEPTPVLTDPVQAEPTTSVAPGIAPQYPFPKMPGMRTLRRSHRFDEELGRWVFMRAQRVPAPLFAVESFYTKAFKDEGLSVTRIDEPLDAQGTRRVTIRARSRGGKAQVAIRQASGELQTTARVIWQTDPSGA